MGNITALRQGSLNGLRRQTNECLVNAYNKGYQDGMKEFREVKAVNVEDTSDYRIGYKVGYEDGKKQAILEIPEIANNENEMYDKGLENARQVILKLLGINSSEYTKIFNDTDMYYTQIILEHYSIKEIESKIKAYEETKQAEEEWKIGDELYSETTNRHAIIVRVDAWNSYECFSDDGIFKITDEFKKYWVKTGHFAEVSQLLDKLKGVDE